MVGEVWRGERGLAFFEEVRRWVGFWELEGLEESLGGFFEEDRSPFLVPGVDSSGFLSEPLMFFLSDEPRLDVRFSELDSLRPESP